MIQKDAAIVFWFYQLLVEKLCVVWITRFKKKSSNIGQTGILMTGDLEGT